PGIDTQALPVVVIVQLQRPILGQADLGESSPHALSERVSCGKSGKTSAHILIEPANPACNLSAAGLCEIRLPIQPPGERGTLAGARRSKFMDGQAAIERVRCPEAGPARTGEFGVDKGAFRSLEPNIRTIGILVSLPQILAHARDADAQS